MFYLVRVAIPMNTPQLHDSIVLFVRYNSSDARIYLSIRPLIQIRTLEAFRMQQYP